VDYFQMTAPCGLDCFNCPLYRANEDPLLKIAIAKKLNIPTAKADCQGCRGENGDPPCHAMSGPCQVYRCIAQKELDFCYECEDFPCDHLHPYADKAADVPHNTKVFNLCLIKKMGLEKWAKEKAKQVKDTYFKEKWKI
jgi:hypothetical protein